MAKARTAKVARETKETRIALSLSLDGSGKHAVDTGVGFFDHMLSLLSRHSLIDLTVKAAGDVAVDDHHTVEDVGICLGQALAQALGQKAGIQRYGWAAIPMDEALATAAVDLAGRAHLTFKGRIATSKVGAFDTALVEEFFQAMASHAQLTLHVEIVRGKNSHHAIEAAFKAVARALRQAVAIDPREKSVPSTKGTL